MIEDSGESGKIRGEWGRWSRSGEKSVVNYGEWGSGRIWKLRKLGEVEGSCDVAMTWWIGGFAMTWWICGSEIGGSEMYSRCRPRR